MIDQLFFFSAVLLIILDLYMLSTSRLTSLIQAAAIQGAMISAFPFLVSHLHFSVHVVALGLGCFLVKGILIPHFLFRALRGENIAREEAPFIGYTVSILYGIAAISFSFWLMRKIPSSPFLPSPLQASVALAMGFMGFFLIIARRKAISQVVGYLVLENATFILGISLSAVQPLLVEMGVLLDVLVGVFIMGIVIHHIRSEYDSILTDRLEQLRQ